ncbi:MAG: dethiobiotin synthase [Hydrogenimonas sp.]|nr:dethiobiotin synthase [Hydrogenimonas sp.]
MAIKIFVTATNTGIGKTHTTLLLMETAKKRGLLPAAFKPIETGVEDTPLDGTKLLKCTKKLNPNSTDLTLEDIVPIRYPLPAAPYVAKGKESISVDYLKDKMNEVEKVCDILFIEGAGGVLVPIEDNLFMADLPKIFDAKTLLVSPSRLGSINDTLLSIEALRNKEVEPVVAVNLFEEADTFEKITRPYYLQSRLEHYLLPKQADDLLIRLLKA